MRKIEYCYQLLIHIIVLNEKSDADPDELLYGSWIRKFSIRIRIRGKKILTKFKFSNFCEKYGAIPVYEIG